MNAKDRAANKLDQERWNEQSKEILKENLFHRRVEELQNYFYDQIISRKFNITEQDGYATLVKVMGRYNFSFWNSTGEQVSNIYNDYMILNLSDGKKRAIYKVFQNILEQRQDDIREKEKLKRKNEYLKLKKEFE